METIFRVDVIKRGFKCGLIVWTAGRKKENVSQLGLIHFLSQEKENWDYLLVTNAKTIISQ